MALAVFEPVIAACEWPQTHALDGAATGADEDTASKNVQIGEEMR
jgi:hypothetical protein